MKFVKGWYVPDHMKHAGNHLRRSEIIDLALAYLPRDRHTTVVQAGGHIGIWPVTLAQHFEMVYCWEPIPQNWECLIANCGEIENIYLTQGCLGNNAEIIRMRFSKKNTGKHCVMPSPNAGAKDGTHETTIEKLDDFPMLREKPSLDALFLDVEGFELPALMGAHALIHNFKPLLVIEENGLQSRYGIADEAVENYLKSFGYVQAQKHDEDVIYVQEEWL